MNTISLALICIGAALSIGIAGFGAGIGMGNGLRGACEGVARNPDAQGAITTTMIIGMALCESIAIYGLCLCSGPVRAVDSYFPGLQPVAAALFL